MQFYPNKNIYATDENGAGGSEVDASSQEVVVFITPQNDTLSSLDVEDKTDEVEKLMKFKHRKSSNGDYSNLWCDRVLHDNTDAWYPKEENKDE